MEVFNMLPQEMWYSILSFLDARELLLISEVTSSLHHLPQDEILWKRLCYEKFGTSASLPANASLWREFYSQHTCYNGSWDSDNMGKMLLSEDGLTITHGGDFLGSYQCARGTTPITSGVCYWEINIDKLSPQQTGFHVVIGVVPETFNCFNTYLSSNGGIGYLADGRKANNSGNGDVYSAKFQEGDKVGVLVDMLSRTLSFYLNGVNQGVAFTEINGPLYPAVSLLTGGQQVSLNIHRKFPQMH